MATANYLGRKYDLLVLSAETVTDTGVLSQQLVDEKGGEICAGIRKLSQRWVLEFLTELGSLTFATNSGTTFMTRLRKGLLRTEADVLAEFNFAAMRIQRQLRNEEESWMQDDERLDRAELQQLLLAQEEISLKIKITSVAGDSRQIILPISTLPVPLL